MNSDDTRQPPPSVDDASNTAGTTFAVDIEDPKERIQKFIDAYRLSEPNLNQGIDESLMRNHIKIISAQLTTSGSVAVFGMRHTPEFANRMGNMHGGAVCLIYDMCTTMCAAPLATKDFWLHGGVSRNLAITFLRPVTPQMELLIECEVLQQGERLATIKGAMKDKATGKILSVAEHNKASIRTPPSKSRL